MAKIIMIITKEGEIKVDGIYKGDACERSPLMKKITKIIEQEGEIDNIKLKYEKTRQKEKIKITAQEVF